MDVGGSFLELSCVRIALIPAGATIADHRFEELTSYLTAFREVPVSALPRRAAVPRTTGNATFSSMPTALREALAEASPPSPLLRSHSASKDIGRLSQPNSFPSIRKGVSRQMVPKSNSELSYSSTKVELQSVSLRQTEKSTPLSPRHTPDLDMTGPEVDCSFRLRYDIIHRDQSGVLIMKPFSEWDDFHSSKIWGVFGIADCTQDEAFGNPERRKQAIFDAYDDFNETLDNFKDASVRRLIVFTSQDANHEDAPFVLNNPKSPAKSAKPATPLNFSVGYVLERSKYEETRLEIRAQVTHFAGLLLHALDRDCWKRRESPPTDLFLSPIDERYSADRQSKLAKRRPGRLDKLLGDSLLLMGSPGEAIARYTSAIEKAKANSDRLWLAGAMEGWSAAHVLNHVGSGGSVSDPLLSDRLIVHYTEIYKLYQKKRVAEPEAAAALRLAEFLGRWTNRRKDALDAAGHAATVGEGLRLQKRAVLWQALARFSDWMGCRRKAALYLYRLGHLNASQSIWSSAVTLMIASERQLTKGGKKPWASLNRRVLLTAAQHAEEAGDLHTTARLRVEALVVAPQGTMERSEDDEELLEALSTVQVPAHLPAAIHVVRLGDISALQLQGLTIRARKEESGVSESTTISKDGPFIYNPFEAKKRAKAEAVARRAVTWVRGEPAQVGVRLLNQICADLVIDVIAVILVSAASTQDGEMEKSTVECSLDSAEGSSSTQDPSNESAAHRRRVQTALRKTSKIAKSVQESFVLPSKGSQSGNLKKITVIPKRSGPLYVDGLLVRLFKGALVVLRKERDQEAPPVNVVASLPQIRLSSYSVDGGTLQNISSQAPLTVYRGERRRFRMDIEKTGNEPITWMRVKVLSSDPEALEIIGNDFESEGILDGLESQGASKSFSIQVLGKRGSLKAKGSFPYDEGSSWSSRPAVVSVNVEYEGSESSGVVRESKAYVKMAVLTAIEVRRINVCNYRRDCSELRANGPPELSMYVEVRNYVSAPATVSLAPFDQLCPQSSGRPSRRGTRTETFADQECLVEDGASARLICNLAVESIKPMLVKLRGSTPSEPAERTPFCIRWNYSALGRHGFVIIDVKELSRAVARCGAYGLNQHGPVADLPSCIPRVAQAEIAISVESHSNEALTANTHAHGSAVPVGAFCQTKVQVWNKSDTKLPPQSVLDIGVVQNDGHGHVQQASRVIVVGATERVFIGALASRAGSFEHTVRVRVPSTGTYQIQAILYDDALQKRGGKSPISLVTSKRQAFLAVPGKATRTESHLSKTGSLGIVLASENNTATRDPLSQMSRNNETGPSGRDLDLNPSGSFSRSSKNSSGLKKVAPSRSARTAEGKIAPIIIQPKTVDTYPTISPQRRPFVLGFCSMSLTGVQETSAISRNEDSVSSTL